jgi:DNA (cytosine-5)-methyltransferase 1
VAQNIAGGPRQLRLGGNLGQGNGAECAPLRVAGLFAGIGGIELGLERAGHRTEFVCEIDPGAVAVLRKRFPGLSLHPDVTTVRSLPPNVQLLTAGFPCQDLSQAGATAGIQGHRSSLVAHVFRLLERRRIPWVLIENVPFMLQLGRGRALEVILRELERLGYRWAYRVVNSLAFGLPQRRERVFLLASRRGDPRNVLLVDDVGEPDPIPPRRDRSFGFYWTEGIRGLGAAVDAIPTLKGGSTVGIPSPPAVVLPEGRVVTPAIEAAERLQGFAAGWTEPAEEVVRRGYRWKLVGNAVTVDVAMWIGQRLRSPGAYDASWDTRIRGGPWPRAAWGDGKGGRFASDVSSWPCANGGQPFHEFVPTTDRNDLSVRATMGFLSRLRSGSLRRPRWFEPLLERHIDRMASIEKRTSSRQ